MSMSLSMRMRMLSRPCHRLPVMIMLMTTMEGRPRNRVVPIIKGDDGKKRTIVRDRHDSNSDSDDDDDDDFGFGEESDDDDSESAGLTEAEYNILMARQTSPSLTDRQRQRNFMKILYGPQGYPSFEPGPSTMMRDDSA
ncbi:hypothetical protein K435DRAFT_393362 [Dendrothele bispora CBS 962.96]|uniref:Uncharacterized protein n=1 Tax=Dendrothele bispora (strain CBS 962.96) TaxID=1314807 RepID=A0A4S8L952_DENBC|nr:hypothetical protein K435DRAFT_393362 [Dendrothele bispora CBS 962.96]